jgi:hypothetical protein
MLEIPNNGPYLPCHGPLKFHKPTKPYYTFKVQIQRHEPKTMSNSGENYEFFTYVFFLTF